MSRKVFFAFLCYFFIFSTNSYSKPIREVEANEKKVIGVSTAVGYSTILEFTSRPTSAILGDQDAFKLEYLKNSITIKPLIPHAKSNLFIFTEYDRFNCTLSTGPSSSADYIVRISAPHNSPSASDDSENGDEPTSIKKRQSTSVTMTINKIVQYAGFSLKVVSVTRPKNINSPNGSIVLDFTLSSQKRRHTFSPQALGIRQGKNFLSIEDVYLDSLDLIPRQNPIHGKIVILLKDLFSKSHLEMVFAVPSINKKEKVHRIVTWIPLITPTPIKSGGLNG